MNIRVLDMTRYIDIRRDKDPIFGGKDVHELRFSLNKQTWHTVVLTTKELRVLRRKLRIYLKTLDSDE